MIAPFLLKEVKFGRLTPLLACLFRCTATLSGDTACLASPSSPPPPPGQQLHGPAGQQEPLRAQHVHDRPSPGRRALFCWAAGWSMTCKTTPVRKCLKWGGVDASGSNATHGHPMLRQRVKPRRWAAAARRGCPQHAPAVHPRSPPLRPGAAVDVGPGGVPICLAIPCFAALLSRSTASALVRFGKPTNTCTTTRRIPKTNKHRRHSDAWAGTIPQKEAKCANS